MDEINQEETDRPFDCLMAQGFTGEVLIDKEEFSISQLECLREFYQVARMSGCEIGQGYFQLYVQFDRGCFKGFRLGFAGT